MGRTNGLPRRVLLRHLQRRPPPSLGPLHPNSRVSGGFHAGENRSSSKETATPGKYRVDDLIQEYKDLAGEVRKDFNGGLLQGATVVALAALVAGAARLDSWPVAVLASLVMIVLAALAVRNMAEYHAMGGYKRAIEETLRRLLGPTPWVWESAVVPATRTAVVNAVTWLFSIVVLVAVALAAVSAFHLPGSIDEELASPLPWIAATIAVVLGGCLVLAFLDALRMSERACASAFERLACHCANGRTCLGEPEPAAPASGIQTGADGGPLRKMPTPWMLGDARGTPCPQGQGGQAGSLGTPHATARAGLLQPPIRGSQRGHQIRDP